ncbi:hypothetical protein BN1232_02264 [Mycobacterium lentiflavum]|uniref:Uncharacterized protein n=1 Tax=Mycobacterium lentiflavum TaxID=141349 RepID=A0A0E3WC41_MYCLN|nr:hypothetical protein [Mycobacterium lentiflavum]CQD11986.1 hypothetical protein BN1232_02264 [Mycobacterium lentiflavum]
MTTTTNPYPDLPVPNGIEMQSDWDSDGYRDLFGFDRTVTDHKARVYALGSQSTDGTISGLIVVAYGEDDGFDLNTDQARELAAALLAAVAEVESWWPR